MQKQTFDSRLGILRSAADVFQQGAGGQSVCLPHDAAIGKPRSAAAATRGSGGYAWSGAVAYRKKFQVPAEWQGGTASSWSSKECTCTPR